MARLKSGGRRRHRVERADRIPGEGEVLVPPGPPEDPRRVKGITPGEDLASAAEHRPVLDTIELEGRIAGVRADETVHAAPTLTTRNISGEAPPGQPHAGLYMGPERRSRQTEPARWAHEDRRARPFTYGDRRTL